MLGSLFLKLSSHYRDCYDRSEGVAFLKASAALYSLASLCYLGLNIPKRNRGESYLNCAYSDRCVRQKVVPKPIDVTQLEKLALLSGDVVDWNLEARLDTEARIARSELPTAANSYQLLTFSIPTNREEAAIIGVASSMPDDAWETFKSKTLKDLRILGTYFHNHILRLNGNDATCELLLSARELDCLKWTAAGKTAWEASKILGVSERTVRFHLNSAREKLQCANTTQAVATAISQRLISI